MFGFVVTDMKQDVGTILKRLDDKEKQEESQRPPATVQTLLKDAAITTTKKDPSPEALKRLYVEGDFIREFLKRTLEDLDRSDSLVEMGQGN